MTPSRARRMAALAVLAAGLLGGLVPNALGGAVVVLALALAATLLFGERGALYLLILLAPLEVYRALIPSLGVNGSPFRIGLLYVLAQTAVLVLRERRLPRPDRVLVGFAGLVALEVLTLFRALEPSTSIRIVGGHAAGLVAAAVLSDRLRSEHPRHLALGFLVSASLPLVLGLAVFVTQTPGEPAIVPGLAGLEVTSDLEERLQAPTYSGTDLARAEGTLLDPNQFAAFLVAAVLLAVGLASEASGRARHRLALGALLGVVGILMTFSKSGLLSLFGGLAILRGRSAGAAARKAGMLRATFVLVSVATVLAAAWTVAPSVLRERLDPFSAPNETSTRLHEQTRLDALSLYGEYPILGVGPGNFGPVTGADTLVSSTHSVYTTVLAELGTVGILLFLLTPALLALRLRRRKRAGTDVAAEASLLVTVYGVLLLNNVLYEVWANEFQWVLVGLVAAATCRVPFVRERIPANATRAMTLPEGAPPSPVRAG